MAVFHKWLKGCHSNATIKTGGWTRITFSEFDETKNIANSPTINISNGYKEDNISELGNILTTKTTGIIIDEPWTFKQINFGDQSSIYYDSSNSALSISSSVKIGNLSLNNDGTINTQGNITTESSITATGSITTEGKCEAQYFNATSDRRAKTNIVEVDFNATDLINQLQIYGFNYKNNNEAAIGIIAQEALPHNIGEFSLVDNPSASGENGDYMAIKESKLVYILWKAIQELSAEVTQLKEQIKRQ